METCIAIGEDQEKQYRKVRRVDSGRMLYQELKL
jgi:hypothetical protein